MRLEKEEPLSQVESLLFFGDTGNSANMVVTDLVILPHRMKADDPKAKLYAFRVLSKGYALTAAAQWTLFDPDFRRVESSTSFEELVEKGQQMADDHRHDGQTWSPEGTAEQDERLAALREKVEQAQQQLDAAQAVLDFESAQPRKSEPDQEPEPDQGWSLQDQWERERDQEPDQERPPLAGMIADSIMASFMDSASLDAESGDHDDQHSPADTFDMLVTAQYLALIKEFKQLKEELIAIHAGRPHQRVPGGSKRVTELLARRNVLRTRIHRLKWLMGTEHVPDAGAESGYTNTRDEDAVWELSVTM